jgi:hypothetical protein
MATVRTAAFCGLLALGALLASEAASQQPQPVSPPAAAPDAAQARGSTQDIPDTGSHFTFGVGNSDIGSLPNFSFEIGKWGITSSPHADTSSQRGQKDDPACNMPSSHCWNEDRP